MVHLVNIGWEIASLSKDFSWLTKGEDVAHCIGLW